MIKNKIQMKVSNSLMDQALQKFVKIANKLYKKMKIHKKVLFLQSLGIKTRAHDSLLQIAGHFCYNKKHYYLDVLSLKLMMQSISKAYFLKFNKDLIVVKTKFIFVQQAQVNGKFLMEKIKMNKKIKVLHLVTMLICLKMFGQKVFKRIP